MHKHLTVFLLFFFTCCSEKKDKSNSDKFGNVIGLSQEMYSKLKQYQKLYPIPQNGGNGLYVYEADFVKYSGDTILSLWRSSGGYGISDGEVVFGVYKDQNLLPTIIKDSRERYGQNFIFKELKDSLELQRVRTVDEHSYPESFPPIFRFKVRNEKLILFKIDTVWTKWRS